MMETVVAPLSPNQNGSEAFAIDPTVVIEYLSSVIQITLGATRKELESSGSLLSPDLKGHSIQRCIRFASDNQVALYVTKDIASAGDIDGALAGAGMLVFLYRHTCD